MGYSDTNQLSGEGQHHVNTKGGIHLPRHIKVKGIIRNEIDEDTIAHVYFMMGKKAVQEKRRRAAMDRKGQKGTAIED